MYLPDLAPYPYRKWPAAFAVGWLDPAHPYPQGRIPVDFVERLSIFCSRPTLVTMGIHTCDFCQSAEGSAESWIFGAGDIVYIVPDLIMHYIETHQYQPPDVFIQAVKHSPLPETPEYQARVQQVRRGPSASQA